MAETSLGEGIGLQQGANRDDFWAKQIYQRGAERKREKEKADEELIKMSDFLAKSDKLLPVFANDQKRVYYDFMQKLTAARQRNPNSVRSAIEKDFYEAKWKMEQIQQNNARGMDFLANDKIYQDPEAVKVLTGVNSTYDDLATLHDGQYFMTDNTGTFAYRGAPKTFTPPKFDEYSKQRAPTGKYKISGNLRETEYQNTYDQPAIETMATRLALDPEFQEYVWSRNRKMEIPEGADPQEERVKLVQQKAMEEIQKRMPKGTIEWEKTIIPQGRESDSDKPKPQAIINPPTKMTVTAYSSPQNPIGKKSTVDVPFSTNVPNSKAVEIPISRKIFDATTNRPLTGSGTITIKPTSVIPVKKNNGEWENMVIGKAVKSNSSDGEVPLTYGDKFTASELMILEKISKKDAEDKLKQEINLQVPYESVKGSVESSHSMGDYFKMFDELKKGSGGIYEIKGKKYTEDDLLKMGYTTEQIAPYKKK